MCRIIGFVGSVGGVGKTSLVFEFAKHLASLKQKVCVFDGCFSNNSIIYKFNKKDSVDFKEYLVGDCLPDDVLNNETKYMCFVKTNSSSFNYVKYAKMIERFFEEIESEFDYILVDVGHFISLFLKIVTEVIVVTDDYKESVLKTYRLLKKVKMYENVLNVKLVLNKACVALEMKGERISKSDYEEFLKTEVLCVVPKFVKWNYFNYKNITKNNKVFIENFCNVLITNQASSYNYEKKFKGVIGFFRRKWHEKFE